MSVYRTIGPLVGICSRSQVSVYRTIGPLVMIYDHFFGRTLCVKRVCMIEKKSV